MQRDHPYGAYKLNARGYRVPQLMIPYARTPPGTWSDDLDTASEKEDEEDEEHVKVDVPKEVGRDVKGKRKVRFMIK